MSQVIDANGNIKVTFESNFTPLTVTGDTVLDGTYRIILVDATGGNVTLTLPAVSSGSYQFVIKKTDATGYTVTVDGASSETIDNQLTQVIAAQYTTLVIINNPLGWWII